MPLRALVDGREVQVWDLTGREWSDLRRRGRAGTAPVLMACCGRPGLVHLSRAAHGGSPTRFGVRVLNPVRVRIESRYLAERVVIGQVPLQEAMRTLGLRLAANKVVSITVGAQGAKTRAAPFLGGELRVATGAPNLALRTGAPLLPVFTVREQPGRFLTTVEPPLQADPGLGRERATQALVAGLVARIEGRARRWPDQFHWHDDVTGWGLHAP